MARYGMGAVEQRFAELIWENEPVASGELVRLAQSALGWKKSTTYTILRRLCQRGLFRNEGGAVTSVVSRADYFAEQSESFVQETFSGSLPRFLTAFSARRSLSEEEIQALQRLIDENRGRPV